jgi:hypothetical protein
MCRAITQPSVLLCGLRDEQERLRLARRQGTARPGLPLPGVRGEEEREEEEDGDRPPPAMAAAVTATGAAADGAWRLRWGPWGQW